MAGTLDGDVRLRPEDVLGGWLSTTQSGGVLQAEQGRACPPRGEQGQVLQPEANGASYWDTGHEATQQKSTHGKMRFHAFLFWSDAPPASPCTAALHRPTLWQALRFNRDSQNRPLLALGLGVPNQAVRLGSPSLRAPVLFDLWALGCV